MNKIEAAYHDYLELRRMAGEIVWHHYEGIKFRLADRTWYTPDFTVMMKTGEMQVHEVKGFWEDDAKVKIKVAADLYPLQFIAVKKKGKGWVEEVF